MNNKVNDENNASHKTLQWIIVVFSIIFVIVLANGYYNLLINTNRVFAFFIGCSLAFLAWNLAKFIGSSSEKILGNFPLFILLLVLSALGVFNSLMTNLEGKRIFQETIDDSSLKFRELPIIAKEISKNPAIEAKQKKVESLKQMFFEELRNPQNCGQGATAKNIADQIKNELPAFQILSGKVNCIKIEPIISSYDESINTLLQNSKEYIDGNQLELEKLAGEVIQKEKNAQEKLNQIRTEINNGGNLLVDARLDLEGLATLYQNTSLELSKIDLNAKLPASLEMNSVRNLGEWSQIINLIISRLDKPSTYVYLLLAFFFDWILIYLFSRLKEIANKLSVKKVNERATKIDSPW